MSDRRGEMSQYLILLLVIAALVILVSMIIIGRSGESGFGLVGGIFG